MAVFVIHMSGIAISVCRDLQDYFTAPIEFAQTGFAVEKPRIRQSLAGGSFGPSGRVACVDSVDGAEGSFEPYDIYGFYMTYIV